MTHVEAIYQSIPNHVKNQFEAHVAVILSNIFEDIQGNPWLSDEEKVFFTALGKASKAGEHGAVYEAFGKVLTDE
ncbi:hypothetical protein G6672_00205 [Polynucleobacter paneuropaeus]|nr:hypothetical protein [Polynucleobacter paneuropaeus]MBT8635676.1 hypothetical protein [Polynucleobacter paneuropaeus]MBT8637483.1 hypothetical protein [Polynucleobacter paneuropaeus]